MDSTTRLTIFLDIINISWECVREYAPDVTIRDIEPAIRDMIANKSEGEIRYTRTIPKNDGGVLVLLDSKVWCRDGKLHVFMHSEYLVTMFWFKTTNVRAQMPQNFPHFPEGKYDEYAEVLCSTDIEWISLHPERDAEDEEGNIDFEYDVIVIFPLEVSPKTD